MIRANKRNNRHEAFAYYKKLFYTYFHFFQFLCLVIYPSDFFIIQKWNPTPFYLNYFQLTLTFTLTTFMGRPVFSNSYHIKFVIHNEYPQSGLS